MARAAADSDIRRRTAIDAIDCGETVTTESVGRNRSPAKN